MQGMLGKKVGMTQIFADDGKVVPVTVLEIGPCVVVQRKTEAIDGYEAVQIGLVEHKPFRRASRPVIGHFEKAGLPPARRVEEFAIDVGDELEPGGQVDVSLFADQEYVDVTAISKGKGFQGVIKRHGFSGGRATHGSMFHRAPGSIGASAYPSRVYPGRRLPGRMGGKRITAKNLRVVKVDQENNLMYVRGAVPGANGGYVTIRRAKRG